MINKKSALYNSILCIIETILINIIVYFFFFARQANQEVYLFLNPNPLLFLSLVMGLRYGMKLGSISAIISCAFYMNVFMKTNGDIKIFFNFFKYYKYPLLFLWSAFVLGAFSDNYKRKLKISKENIELVKKDNKYLEKDYKVLEKILNELKNQIIGSDESIISLYDIATRLESFETEEIYTETIGILIKYLRATDISLYTYDNKNGYLRLKISYGKVNEESSSIEAFTCPWFTKVSQARKVVKVATDFEENDSPLMSAPLIRNKKIIAVVNIKAMEFNMISEYAFNLFQLIIDWINRSLDKATYVETLKESKYLNNTHLVTAKYFKDRIMIEKRRKTEFGMNYCFLAYRVINLNLEEIDKLVIKTLRDVDVAYYNFDSNTLSFLLPATNKSNDFILEQKIKKNFNNNLTSIDLKQSEE